MPAVIHYTPMAGMIVCIHMFDDMVLARKFVYRLESADVISRLIYASYFIYRYLKKVVSRRVAVVNTIVHFHVS
jgi:hypothetical protein